MNYAGGVEPTSAQTVHYSLIVKVSTLFISFATQGFVNFVLNCFMYSEKDVDDRQSHQKMEQTQHPR